MTDVPGLGAEFWAPVREMWAGPRDAIDASDVLTLDWVKMQYTTGEPRPESIPPERAFAFDGAADSTEYWLDYALTVRPVYRDALIDLLWDCAWRSRESS